ncbi:hypothetical protein MOQ_009652 [Trypanosoma cruzi marinkellei]|uniref:Uncharacterized protein n=1 Tax=Trypanosoma cruzi marinkellei TaxID=85056 RepID=K2NCA5_TRYCR|nr:hypothetical protein MOQ_009652 [Trypanosoma cruzi marinkellei]
MYTPSEAFSFFSCLLTYCHWPPFVSCDEGTNHTRLDLLNPRSLAFFSRILEECGISVSLRFSFYCHSSVAVILQDAYGTRTAAGPITWASPIEDDEDEAVSSGVGSAGRSEAGRDNRELQEVMRGAPLLVEFRRLILRDVMDRLGELKDEQSMTMDNIMVSLKEEMRKEVCRNLNGAADGRVGPDGGSKGEAVRRLKGFDQNYVQRGEVVATLQEKADRATVAQKADEACVHDLEKRLLERIEDLEERMTIYEAERTEFRRILRSLVDVHRRGEDVHYSDRHRDRGAANKGCDDGATRTARALPNFVVLDEAIEPQRARECESLAAEEPRAPRRARQRTDLTTSRASAREQERNQSPYGVAEKRLEVGGKAVGLTANQEAYANYVTNELNRRVVESLPPLPYERGR